MQIYSWVCLSCCCDTGSEMNVVAGVEEVGVGHDADTVPFSVVSLVVR